MKKGYKILVVDDMKNFREMVCNILIDNGFLAEPAGSGDEAIERLKDRSFNIVFLDLDMPGMDGLETLKIIKRDYPEVYVIILTVTAYADPETIVKAMKSGADDFVIKAEEEELVFRINKAIEKIDLRYQLQEEIKKEYDFSNIIGESKSIKEIFGLIEKVAPTDSTVLIQGESGTGKELVARAIHYNSLRRERSFVPINCAAIPETLLESELFGIEEKVATGVSKREGRFEQAHLGTIFLDEVGDMFPALQAKLLRVLQEQEFERVGGRKPIKVDARVIAATNKDLMKAVEEKRFREDLYYRLKVFPIYLQPLRERREDIPLLLNYFLQRYNQKVKKNISKVSKEAMDLLIQYDYSGNIRELENIIERAVILSDGDTILPEALPLELRYKKGREVLSFEGLRFAEAKEKFEKEYIISALTNMNGNIAQAAEVAGLDRNNFKAKMKRYGIEAKGFKK